MKKVNKLIALFFCLFISVNVSGCSNGNASGKNAQAATSAADVLTECVSAFGLKETAVADYTHTINSKDGTVQKYKVTIEADRRSFATHVDGHQDVSSKDKQILYSPVSLYFYDTDNGSRVVYEEGADGWTTFMKETPYTIMRSLNAAEQLQRDLTDGLTALKAVRSVDKIIVTGSAACPDIASIEDLERSEEDPFTWTVELMIRADTNLPEKAVFKRDNEEIVIDYISFNTKLDFTLPDLELPEE